MDIYISIISVILVLAGLIFFHELGHFLVARAFGMGVTTFSLGFGPKLWKHTHNKTEYCLSAVPLGGYCALVGEEDDSELPKGFTKEESFALRPAWQRLCVVAAGPLANILLALVIAWGLTFSYGNTYLAPVIGEVIEGSAAAHGGLQQSDIVQEVNGHTVHTWEAMATLIADSQGEALHFVLARDNTTHNITIKGRPVDAKNIFGEKTTRWVVGIRASGQLLHEDVGFFEAAVLGVERTWDMIVLTWTGFVKLFQGSLPMKEVGGPIRIAQMVGQQATEGLNKVLALAALISINLGILNLLPIPVLDGGHIVFFTLEMIFRRPISVRIRTISTQVGFALLICLMVFATYNDIALLLKS